MNDYKITIKAGGRRRRLYFMEDGWLRNEEGERIMRFENLATAKQHIKNIYSYIWKEDLQLRVKKLKGRKYFN